MGFLHCFANSWSIALTTHAGSGKESRLGAWSGVYHSAGRFNERPFGFACDMLAVAQA